MPTNAEIPKPESYAISAASMVAALYDAKKIGQLHSFIVHEEAIKALQSAYVALVLEDLKLKIHIEACGTFSVAWLEES